MGEGVLFECYKNGSRLEKYWETLTCRLLRMEIDCIVTNARLLCRCWIRCSVLFICHTEQEMMFGFSSTLEVHIESTNIDVFTVVHGEMSDISFVSYRTKKQRPRGA